MSRHANAKRRLSRIAAELGMGEIPPDWVGIDAVLPLLERMRLDGAVVLIKLDGERGPGDNGAYTVVASGGLLGSKSCRMDAPTLEGALAYVVCHYAIECWRASG